MRTELFEETLKKLAEDKMSFYELLAIQKNATLDQINVAFRSQSLLYHPDRNPNNFALANTVQQKLQEAKTILSDPEKRREYDGRFNLPQQAQLKEYQRQQAYEQDDSVFLTQQEELQIRTKLFQAVERGELGQHLWHEART